MKNSSGSALLIVLLLIAAAIATTLVVLQGSVGLSQIYSRKTDSQISDNVTQLFSALLSEPTVCLDGFDGAGGEAGLQFLVNGSPSTFDSVAAASATGQSVSLPSNFPGPNGRLRLIAGTVIPNSNLVINKLYVANAVLSSGAYDMDLVAEFTAGQGNVARGLSPRKIMKLRAVIAAGVPTSCASAPSLSSNQSLCQGMNCTYTTSPSGQGNCYCPVQPVTCANGTYVASIVNYTPQCSASTISRSCSPNYLVALDQSGNAVCGQVVICPAGTSAGGLGGAASPVECKCASTGDTWDSSTSTCGAAAVTCTGGATTSVTAVAASPAGCYCATGTTWTAGTCTASPVAGTCGGANGGTFADSTAANTAGLCLAGSASPSSLSGSGPWSWSCVGSSSTASCSASAGSCIPQSLWATTCPAGFSSVNCGTGWRYCSGVLVDDPRNPMSATFAAGPGCPVGYQAPGSYDDSSGSCSTVRCFSENRCPYSCTQVWTISANQLTSAMDLTNCDIGGFTSGASWSGTITYSGTATFPDSTVVPISGSCSLGASTACNMTVTGSGGGHTFSATISVYNLNGSANSSVPAPATMN